MARAFARALGRAASSIGAAGSAATVVRPHLCSRCDGRCDGRPTNFRIGFCTDVEGDRQYWKRYVQHSEVLDRTECGALSLREGCHFVFGGDAVDKGDGDLEVLRDLVLLKRRYPGRVHLLLGNRDTNKLRLAHELSETYLAMPCSRVWFQGIISKQPIPGPGASAAERLRWILHETMGAKVPDAFELRRSELQRARPSEVVTDDAVVESYRALAVPGGLMEEYLSLGEFAVHYEEGALFVHGALDDTNVGRLPWRGPSSSGEVLDLPAWVASLNEFARAQMAAWRQGAWAFPSVWSQRGGYNWAGGGLMQYGQGSLPPLDEGALPVMGSNPTVVTRSWVRNGHGALPSEAVQEYMRRAGVRAVLSGHQPNGDSPLLLRCAPDLVAASADLSYSANVLWGDALPDAKPAVPCANNRGGAVTELVVDVEQRRVRALRAETVLSSGDRLSACLAVGGGPCGLAGRETRDGWWVKGTTGKGYLCSRGVGYQVFNVVRPLLREEDLAPLRASPGAPLEGPARGRECAA